MKRAVRKWGILCNEHFLVGGDEHGGVRSLVGNEGQRLSRVDLCVQVSWDESVDIYSLRNDVECKLLHSTSAAKTYSGKVQLRKKYQNVFFDSE
jgi:hypothetical protein